jgi:hypothetical protein
MIWSKNVYSLLNRGDQGDVKHAPRQLQYVVLKIDTFGPTFSIAVSSCSFFPCWVIIYAAFQMKNVCQNA